MEVAEGSDPSAVAPRSPSVAVGTIASPPRVRQRPGGADERKSTGRDRLVTCRSEIWIAPKGDRRQRGDDRVEREPVDRRRTGARPLIGSPLIGEADRSRPLIGRPLIGSPLIGQAVDREPVDRQAVDRRACESRARRGSGRRSPRRVQLVPDRSATLCTTRRAGLRSHRGLGPSPLIGGLRRAPVRRSSPGRARCRRSRGRRA